MNSYIGTIKKTFVEVFHYSSDKAPAAIKNELDQLFERKSFKEYLSTNITGRFLSDDQFEITRKWERDASTTTGKGKTMMYRSFFL